MYIAPPCTCAELLMKTNVKEQKPPLPVPVMLGPLLSVKSRILVKVQIPPPNKAQLSLKVVLPVKFKVLTNAQIPPQFSFAELFLRAILPLKFRVL